MNSIGIIGGGVTGLTTAFRLKDKGLPVTLYEASSRVGGPVQSVRKDGYLTEFGPNTMLETSEAVSSLVRDLGLESHKMYANKIAKKRFIVRNGKPVALPSSPPGFISSPLFSLGAKLRLIREPFTSKAGYSQEETVAEFVTRRLGKEFLDYAIDPFVAGVYAGSPEKLSLPHAFPKLHSLEKKYGSLIRGQIKGKKERKKNGEIAKDRAKMFSFDEGLQALIDKLSHKLEAEIKVNTPVSKIEQTAGGWNVYYRDNGTEYINTHSSLVLTLPAYKIAELEHNLDTDLSSLREIYYPPVASIALGFKKDDIGHPLDGFGMLIPKKENFHILGTLFSSTLFPNRTPKGYALLTSYIGGSRQPELAVLPENDLVNIVVEDLQQLLSIRSKPVFTHHVLFKKAIPQYNIGYGKYLDLLTSLEQKAQGLYIAGNFRNGISLSDCIANADKLAGKIFSVKG
jgi:oxygen-dependent protoporphyrinogen oxidase